MGNREYLVVPFVGRIRAGGDVGQVSGQLQALFTQAESPTLHAL